MSSFIFNQLLAGPVWFERLRHLSSPGTKGSPEAVLHKRITCCPLLIPHQLRPPQKDLSLERRLSASYFCPLNLAFPFAPPLSLASPFRISSFPYLKTCTNAILSLNCSRTRSLSTPRPAATKPAPERHLSSRHSPPRNPRTLAHPFLANLSSPCRPDERKTFSHGSHTHPDGIWTGRSHPIHTLPLPRRPLVLVFPAELVMEVLLNLIIKRVEHQNPTPVTSPAPAIDSAGRRVSPLATLRRPCATIYRPWASTYRPWAAIYGA